MKKAWKIFIGGLEVEIENIKLETIINRFGYFCRFCRFVLENSKKIKKYIKQIRKMRTSKWNLLRSSRI